MKVATRAPGPWLNTRVLSHRAGSPIMDSYQFAAREFPESQANAELAKYIWRKAGMSKFYNPTPEYKLNEPAVTDPFGSTIQGIAPSAQNDLIVLAFRSVPF